MKYIDEFRNEAYARIILDKIKGRSDRKLNIMEVCGTHTTSIFRYGIRGLLPENIRLISGPGCPICVTPQSYIDTAIELSLFRNVIIATFGDLMRVPGKGGSLYTRRTEGGDIRVVYSPMDAMFIAKSNPSKKVVFLSVGFETTSPMTAITAIESIKNNIKNLFFLTAHKIVPPVLRSLAEDKDLRIDGFLLPGHVSAIIGEEPYAFLCEEYGIPGVIAGFEPVDILKSIDTLLDMIYKGQHEIKNDYKRIVKRQGNTKAKEYLNEVFKTCESRWRGIGIIPESGHEFNDMYKKLDALKHFKIEHKDYNEDSACRCGEILRGKISPIECTLFGGKCSMDNPLGPCMVSSEGTCGAYYRYYSVEVNNE
jgi:hydrogenase expression/formation protein HypD